VVFKLYRSNADAAARDFCAGRKAKLEIAGAMRWPRYPRLMNRIAFAAPA